MKQITIKSALMRTVTVILLTLSTVSASAQYYASQYRMVIRTVDGLSYPFNVERVDSVYFELVQSEDNGNDEDETTVTGSASDITAYTATITSWANILDNLSTDLKVGIIYTTTGTPNKNNGTQKTVNTSSIGSDAKYTIKLTDLAPSTTYYFCSFVYQSGIWFYGNVKDFTTEGMNEVVVSGDVSKLTCYSAKVSGSISIDESTQYSTLSYGICYGTNSNPTVNDSKVQASSKDSYGNFVCQLRALTGSTTYYYRAYVDVNGYLIYGSIRSFTTKADDVVITGDINSETFTVKSELKIGGGAYSTLELGVCYGTNEHPTVYDKTVTTNEVDDENNFTLTLNDIPYRTVTFYYCAFVKIDGVAHYGDVKSFERIIPDADVDLGLSVKWATCNVGATKPEEYGDYFAWGETEPYYEAGYAQENPQAHWKDGKTSGYTWTNYKLRTSGDSRDNVKFSKYNTSSSYGPIDNNTTLDLEDDVAHVQWGGTWRMPTKAEQDDLRSKCTWTWYSSGNTEFNGVAGYKVTSNIEGYADRFIFLPAAGYRGNTYLYSVGFYGRYWSSSLDTGSPRSAWGFRFGSDGVYTGSSYRYGGFSVRPVCPKETLITSVTLDLTSLSLKESGKYTLKAMAWSGDEEVDTATITWRSDNESVATVSAEGLVTAVAVGTATITATYQDKTASCVVTVEEIQYEYVDLGLSVKWAIFNVGATKPEEYGDYFAWGETETKTDYSWSTYKWCNGSYDTQNKYNTNSSYGTVDNKTTLDPEDDVAHVKWGGNWRMPTKAEQEDLRNKCTWTWYGSGNTEFNGIAGYKVTSNIEGYTDRFIFLPAAGYRYGTNLGSVGLGGYYWSSSLNTGNPYGAWDIRFSSSGVGADCDGRCYGFSVRPVCPKEMPNDPTPTNIITSVTLDSTSLSLKVSGKYTLKAMAWSGDEEVDTATITWRSDNESVATVSAEGLVTAVAVGTATITATYQDKTASCVVTVSAASSQEEIQYEYVDLGLSVKWATCNVGATKPEEYGDYFAWGETEPYYEAGYAQESPQAHWKDGKTSGYTWTNYKFRTSGDSYSNVKFSKYNTSSSYGPIDNNTTLDLEDDVAHVQWGGTWRMPTKAEQDDLLSKCTWTWYSRGNTEFNGVAGYKVTSKIEGYADRFIFLPAAGNRYDTSYLYTVGSYGFYWSSSLYTDYPYGAWYFDFSSSGMYTDDCNRNDGLSVRPVCP